LLVERLEARDFRNLADVEVGVPARIALVHGPNGAGKTNLLEALYFALTGASWRTTNARELIAHGAGIARAEVEISDGVESRHFRASYSRDAGTARRLDGSTPPPDDVALRPALGVFAPDRLELIKGPPAARRSHLDRFVAAVWPARAETRRGYGRALAQRNALLGRVRAGLAPEQALDAWDLELAEQGAALIEARRHAVDALAGPFAQIAEEIGLEGGAELRYMPRSEGGAEQLASELRERRGSDLDRGYSGHGPHLDELKLSLDSRALRRFGSQGQQRTALLALLFAQREALLEIRGEQPVMLLDDVMSELDPERRRLLIDRLAPHGQALITATEPSQVPEECERVEILVRAGAVETAPVPA
jgi:DNA replication and repair protein RecF